MCVGLAGWLCVPVICLQLSIISRFPSISSSCPPPLSLLLPLSLIRLFSSLKMLIRFACIHALFQLVHEYQIKKKRKKYIENKRNSKKEEKNPVKVLELVGAPKTVDRVTDCRSTLRHLLLSIFLCCAAGRRRLLRQRFWRRGRRTAQESEMFSK